VRIADFVKGRNVSATPAELSNLNLRAMIDPSEIKKHSGKTYFGEYNHLVPRGDEWKYAGDNTPTRQPKDPYLAPVHRLIGKLPRMIGLFERLEKIKKTIDEAIKKNGNGLPF